MEGDFIDDGGVAGSSSSIGVGLTFGESSMTSGSCKLVPEGFGMSKRMLFNFLLDEAITAITSLSASEISCRACLMVTSSSGPDVGSSDLFLLFSLICMGCTSDQIWKARCRSFF